MLQATLVQNKKKKKKGSIVLYSCHASAPDLTRLHFFIQNVCLTSNIFFVLQLQEMPDPKIFEMT